MSKKTNRYLYLVEGETEKRLIDYLKTVNRSIQPGKVKILNLFQEKIPSALLATIIPNTVVIVVFDTDLKHPNISLFEGNLKKLRKIGNVVSVLFVPQIQNMEDEIVYSTVIQRIEDFFPTEDARRFKKRFIEASDQSLKTKFSLHNFDVRLLWSRQPNGNFQKYTNNAKKIKF